MQILSENLFPVVGVGASAGGLDAFKTLVKCIPESSGMAYILIQHLAPKFESILAEILQKSTKIPVIEITDNVKVLPNHIYVIPPNRSLTANDGTLHLEPRLEHEKANTIDLFFISLAEIHLEYAIGVVLSGTGRDGTLGLKAIKDHGGITIVQDEDSSLHYGMPKSAIDAEVVDYILAPQHIPNRLVELVKASKMVPANFNSFDELNEEGSFKDILFLIYKEFGVDFTFYKQTTIRRRILRRKTQVKKDKLKDYYNTLFKNKAEQNALFKDLIISVTAFFRDSKTFSFLSESILPGIFKNKNAFEPIRIWIAGCATGEEAYSMAICFYEYMNDHALSRKVQIFATDISEPAIAKARSGMYSKKEMVNISENRCKLFFTKTEGGYQVHKAIREMCVFACQNFLQDPPFANMDLVSCRNVLIYMEPYLQKKALNTFHYSLNSSGFLLLGKSESTGQSLELFQAFNQQENFFIRIPLANSHRHTPPIDNQTTHIRNGGITKGSQVRKNDFHKAADDALLLKYATVGVVVDEQFTILQFRGSTAAYLESPPGKASHNLLKMAKADLIFELRNVLLKAKTSKTAARKEHLLIEKGTRSIDIEVIPLENTIEKYYLVLFQDSEIVPQELTARKRKPKSSVKEESLLLHPEKTRMEQLEKELAQMREDMRLITGDQEMAYEDLQGTNEELLSGSEELQTLNEELQTTKEEIQSSNEELTILNQELIERNEQLIYSRKYAEAIVTTIHEPLIILTKYFEVKSANKAYYEKFNTTPDQTESKSFFELDNSKWDVVGLKDKLERILPDQSYFENMEVRLHSPHTRDLILTLNARQLVNENSSEQLILLAMHDITESKMLEASQQLFAHELEIKVIERTKDLKEANLNLLYYNENLQQFASIASHDLQEPLRKIKTFTSILNKKFSQEMKAEGKAIVEKIAVSTDRMSNLIKEVLQYSKVLQVTKYFQLTDLNLILKNVLMDLDLLIAEKGAIINYKNALPSIDAISLQMNQLFYNLLYNALKFQHTNNAPVITISHTILDPRDVTINNIFKEGISYLRIECSDNGIGFEQEYATQIFQIFERLHSPDEFEGTGIGLALCKKIVENHYGDIVATSQVGKGATFCVTLPIKQ